ncbi:hypothetical protein [Neorhizobium sp. DT-125]|uniref:hypothetical protein n=1 Tax=Neorhizobium sp. DT-125 TaxID=3396163 RepID=UPI003F1AAB7E
MGWLIGCIGVAIIFYFSPRTGVVAIAFLALVWIGLWLVTDRKAEQASNRSVFIAASTDQQLCPNPALPVSVSVTNSAGRSLETVSFNLVARENEVSSIVYRASHTVDKTIPPGDSFSTCYGLNPLSFAIRTIRYEARELNWSAEVSLTRFAGQ